MADTAFERVSRARVAINDIDNERIRYKTLFEQALVVIADCDTPNSADGQRLRNYLLRQPEASEGARALMPSRRDVGVGTSGRGRR